MIGNDIVDLKLARKRNVLRPRFLAKVYANEEQKLILNSDKPMQRAWLLWSMKESAYKLYVQHGGRRRFNPIHFCCTLYSDKRGFVQHIGNTFFTNSESTENYIVSQASFKSDRTTIQCPFSIENDSYQNQHTELYDYMKTELSRVYRVYIGHIAIVKNNYGVPQVYFHKKIQAISLSLSHHGSYGAIAYSDLNFEEH